MKQEWIERPEGGGFAAVSLIVAIARVCGRQFTRCTLYPITLYFLLRRAPERRASRAYLVRVLNRVTWWQVAKHIHCFAAVTLDRVYLLLEKFQRFDVKSQGLETLRAAVALNKGVLLIGSHVGSFDVLRALSSQRSGVAFRTVIDIEQNSALSKILGALNPQVAATIINARRDGIGTAFDIKSALEDGAVVSLLADRARPGHSVVTMDFLGAPAPFPTSPWLLAATLKVPVFLCFGLYRGGNRYELHFESFAEALDIPRRNREALLRATIRRYAERLEYYARLAPYNWFNFYDFWKS
jgi:predicted LPLAT superfamily acyltransferase